MADKRKCLMVVSQLVHDTFFTKAQIDEIRELTELKIVIQSKEIAEKYAELLQEFKPEIVITGWGSPCITKAIYEKVKSIKIMIHSAGGINYAVEKEAMEAGLIVTNWGDTCAPSVAEGTFMMVLASLRKVTYFHNLLHIQKKWRSEGVTTEGLFDKKIGIQGFGKISRALVKLMEPFHCQIQTYSPHVPDTLLAEYGVARAQTLEELYGSNHVVVVLASKTPANYHIVNDKVLSAMPDGAHLILTGRGAVVDTEALIKELRTKRIHAALDVFDPEPLPEDSPMRGMDNVMLIPHMAGPTLDYRINMGALTVDNVRRHLKGEALVNTVAPEMYDLMT